ncbi:GNAT family N-acetyltransferase [Spartinivicinus ruber]|uniref:GNAT family N-acetyltransferase n=1 Tax=Spartinivicinus ruber TaxID=2683272 RepID=UPI0013D56EDB|nr:GNAT family N-acetyltransferase [Spartinivicinus ruber]
MISWSKKPFQALTTDELYACLALREQVFIIEQNCVYQDVDGADPSCFHLLGWQQVDGESQLAAYLRIAPPGLKYEEASLGRVATANFTRGQGLGKELLSVALEWIVDLYPKKPIRISAQAYLERFYQDFGFRSVSDLYDEDGIPHLEMLMQPELR